MSYKHLVPATLAAILLLGSTVGAVYAGSNINAQEMTALKNAKISLAQAITGAEQKSGGKAINAGLNNENGAMTYGVEVVKNNAIQTVLVDMDSGQIVKVITADSEAENNTEQNGQETGN
jgi:hypothetical protein